MRKTLDVVNRVEKRSSMNRLNHIYGFTLLELLVVLVIIGIFAAIAIPSYQQYMLKRDLSVAKQESLRIASELERFKSRNFSYKGFDATFAYPSYDKTKGELLLPIGSTLTNAKYILTVVDSNLQKPLTIAKGQDNKETSESQKVRGLGWVMKVVRVSDEKGQPKDPQNYDLLLRSDGFKCMTKTADIVNDYQTCGDSNDVETW